MPIARWLTILLVALWLPTLLAAGWLAKNGSSPRYCVEGHDHGHVVHWYVRGRL